MKSHSRRLSGGFSMVEVLVSLVVVSTAMMGTAKLTATSLKTANVSFQRSQATFLADDIMDRMRANITAARAGNYNVTPGTPYSYSAPANTLAGYDTRAWVSAIEASLPAGTGRIEADNTSATITIRWADGAQELITTTRL